MNKRIDTLEEAIELWKKLKIEKGEFKFMCGGDSWTDSDMIFYNKKNQEIKEGDGLKLLEKFIETQIMDEIEFYENSDGHYMGEAGTVEIVLDEDSDSEPNFSFAKFSESEWSETYSDYLEIELSELETNILENYIQNINGGEMEEGNVNYKIDCILTDEETAALDDLVKRIGNEAEQHEFDSASGEKQDWYTWSTDDGDDEIEITDGKLRVQVRRSFTEFHQEN